MKKAEDVTGNRCSDYSQPAVHNVALTQQFESKARIGWSTCIVVCWQIFLRVRVVLLFLTNSLVEEWARNVSGTFFTKLVNLWLVCDTAPVCRKAVLNKVSHQLGYLLSYFHFRTRRKTRRFLPAWRASMRRIKLKHAYLFERNSDSYDVWLMREKVSSRVKSPTRVYPREKYFHVNCFFEYCTLTLENHSAIDCFKRFRCMFLCNQRFMITIFASKLKKMIHDFLSAF